MLRLLPRWGAKRAVHKAFSSAGVVANNVNMSSIRSSSQVFGKRLYHSIDDRAPVIDGNIDTNEESYKKNYEEMTGVINQLRDDLATIKKGGGEKLASCTLEEIRCWRGTGWTRC